MELGLKIPKNNFKDLVPYTDIILLDQPVGGLDLYRNKKKIWVYNGTVTEVFSKANRFQADSIIAPSYANDARFTEHLVRDLIDLQMSEHTTYPIMGLWWGYKKDLLVLNHLCDQILLPYQKMRNTDIFEGDNKLYYYWGFKNFDELRRFPPKGLITDMPIRAALNGTDLNFRERRPSLPEIDPEVILTDSQLTQVVENLSLMRKAAKGLL